MSSGGTVWAPGAQFLASTHGIGEDLIHMVAHAALWTALRSIFKSWPVLLVVVVGLVALAVLWAVKRDVLRHVRRGSLRGRRWIP